jgi:hypothetical protein
MHPDSRIRDVVAYRVVCVLEMRSMAVRTVAGCVPPAAWRAKNSPRANAGQRQRQHRVWHVERVCHRDCGQEGEMECFMVDLWIGNNARSSVMYRSAQTAASRRWLRGREPAHSRITMRD